MSGVCWCLPSVTIVRFSEQLQCLINFVKRLCTVYFVAMGQWLRCGPTSFHAIHLQPLTETSAKRVSDFWYDPGSH